MAIKHREAFPSGVSWYKKGIAEVTVNFPEGDVRCSWCPFCRCESELLRYWCRLENLMIYDPFSASLPEFCRLKFEEKRAMTEVN